MLQPPQLAAQYASWVSGCTVTIVGSSSTGKCRRGDDSHAGSMLIRTSSQEPWLRTVMAAYRAPPGAGACPFASVARGAWSTSTGPAAGARNTPHDPPASRRTVTGAPPPRGRITNSYEDGAYGLCSTIVSSTPSQPTA